MIREVKPSKPLTHWRGTRFAGLPICRATSGYTARKLTEVDCEECLSIARVHYGAEPMKPGLEDPVGDPPLTA